MWLICELLYSPSSNSSKNGKRYCLRCVSDWNILMWTNEWRIRAIIGERWFREWLQLYLSTVKTDDIEIYNIAAVIESERFTLCNTPINCCNSYSILIWFLIFLSQRSNVYMKYVGKAQTTSNMATVALSHSFLSQRCFHWTQLDKLYMEQ